MNYLSILLIVRLNILLTSVKKAGATLSCKIQEYRDWIKKINRILL